MRFTFKARLRTAAVTATTVAVVLVSALGLGQPGSAGAAGGGPSRWGVGDHRAAPAYGAARGMGFTGTDLAAARAQVARLPQASYLPPSNYLGRTAAAPGNPSGPWHPVGPAPIDASRFTWGSGQPVPPMSGRVSAIAVDPTTAYPNTTIYLGAAEGGVWKTTNGGQTWAPLTDGQQSLATGSIAIDPNNHETIYIGTGEPNQTLDSYFGSGILKSTDGGATWTLEGESTFGQRYLWISKVLVNPRNSQQVFVATSAGFFASSDGGQTYSAANTGVEACTGGCFFTDLALSADTNPVTLYTATVDGHVYRSTNNAQSWAGVALPAQNGGVSRVAIAVAPSAQNVVYLMIADTAGDVYNPSIHFNGGFYSTNHGTSFTQMASLNLDFSSSGGLSQGWYALTLAVDPTNDQTLYGGSIDIGVTTGARAGTGNWHNIADTFNYDNSGIAPFQHAIAFAPCGTYPCPAYFGNDGGIYFSSNLTASNPQAVTYGDLNTPGLAITDFTGGDLGPNFADTPLALGGSQGDGTEQYTGSQTWPMVAGANGGFTQIDWTNPNTQYTETSGPGNIYKTTDNWAHAQFAGSGIGGGGSFYMPYTLDRSNDQHLAAVTSQVYETVNGGTSWYQSSSVTLAPQDYFTAVAVAPANGHVVYAGTDQGYIYRTVRGASGAATTWVQTGRVPGGLFHITAITVDPTDTTGETAYATTGTFLNANAGHNVFVTTDGGYVWTNISGTLPQFPINSVVTYYSGATPVVVVGTDLGVFFTTNNGGTWTALNNGLPNAPVTQLALDGNDTTLIAYTHGRSAWYTDIPEAAGGTGDTPGIYRPSTTTFYLRNALTTGPADESLTLPGASASSIPLAGTWNGTGLDAVGYFDSTTGIFYLGSPSGTTPSIAYKIRFGAPGDLPVVGDWTGQGRDGIGVYRPSTGTFYLRNSLSAGPPDFTITFGASGDLPVVGDWSGQGYDTVGVYRPSSALFLLSNTRCSYCAASANYIVAFGEAGDVPMVGDWTRSGHTGLGVFRPTNGIVYLKNDATTSGYADFFLIYGIANDRPIAGHWV